MCVCGCVWVWVWVWVWVSVMFDLARKLETQDDNKKEWLRNLVPCS